MKFNIDDYMGKYVMHCKTEEEAKDFCNYLHSVGRKWSSGGSYAKETNYCVYGTDSMYIFNEGLIGGIESWSIRDYKILEWSDFMNKEFTKADLRTGDVVKFENGKVGIANCELKMFIGVDWWLDFDSLKEDLTRKQAYRYDIVAIRRPIDKGDCMFCAFDGKYGTLVYERKEVEEMTLAEVCRLLGREIKIVK